MGGGVSGCGGRGPRVWREGSQGVGGGRSGCWGRVLRLWGRGQTQGVTEGSQDVGEGSQCVGRGPRVWREGSKGVR